MNHDNFMSLRAEPRTLAIRGPLAITLAGIGHHYVARQKALTAISFTRQGGILGVIGRNGSGKTTLLRILATRLHPTDGEIAFTEGMQPLSRRSLRQLIGYVPQTDQIPEQLTTAQFMDYIALLKDLRDPDERQVAIQRDLTACHLWEYRSRRVGDLSGGERRRLLIAQALLGRPRLLLLDEPCTGLDPVERHALGALLGLATDRTTIWASHDLAELSTITPDLLVLDRGRLVFRGTQADLAALNHGDPQQAMLTLLEPTSPITASQARATPHRRVTMTSPARTILTPVTTGLTITITGIQKSYRGKPFALRAIDLQIPPGIFGLLGRNGAGKTTLLQIIATLLEPTSGTVQIGPYTLPRDRWEIRRRLGFLPQEHGFYQNLTVRETLRYFATLQGLRAIDTSVTDALRTVNLEDAARQRVGALSGGMRRRLGLAQALLGDPPLLIVDEPTAGLDPIEQQRFRMTLGLLGARGDRTVILSTHIIEDVAATATHLAVLEAGQVAFSGTPGELTASAHGRAWTWRAPLAEIERQRATGTLAIIGLTPIEIAPGLVEAAIIGAKPHPDATPRPATLTDGYLWSIQSAEASDGAQH